MLGQHVIWSFGLVASGRPRVNLFPRASRFRDRYFNNTIYLNLRFQNINKSYKFVDIIYANDKSNRIFIYNFVFLYVEIVYI